MDQYKYKYKCKLSVAIGVKNPKYIKAEDDPYGDMMYYGMTSDPDDKFIVCPDMYNNMIETLQDRYKLYRYGCTKDIHIDDFDGSTGIALLTVVVYSNEKIPNLIAI